MLCGFFMLTLTPVYTKKKCHVYFQIAKVSNPKQPSVFEQSRN